MSQQINLFNKIQRKQKSAFSLEGMVWGQGVIVVCVLLVYAYLQYQSLLLSKQVVANEGSIASEQLRLDKISAEFSRLRSGLTLEQELKNNEAEVVAQREIINALKSGVIGNTREYSDYMQAFARQVVNGLWLTGFNIDGDARQMSLNGGVVKPELVPAYILRLGNEKVFQGKTFASLHMQLPKVESGKDQNSRYLEFELQSAPLGEDEE